MRPAAAIPRKPGRLGQERKLSKEFNDLGVRLTRRPGKTIPFERTGHHRPKFHQDLWGQERLSRPATTEMAATAEACCADARFAMRSNTLVSRRYWGISRTSSHAGRPRPAAEAGRASGGPLSNCLHPLGRRHGLPKWLLTHHGAKGKHPASELQLEGRMGLTPPIRQRAHADRRYRRSPRSSLQALRGNNPTTTILPENGFSPQSALPPPGCVPQNQPPVGWSVGEANSASKPALIRRRVAIRSSPSSW